MKLLLWHLTERLHRSGHHILCASRRKIDRWVPLATPYVLDDGTTWTPDLNGVGSMPIYRTTHTSRWT